MKYGAGRRDGRALLLSVNERDSEGTDRAIARLRGFLSELRPVALHADDTYLNELFVLDRYVDFLVAYSGLWSKIAERQFSASWTVLQDALDLLRTIKRFSDVPVDFFARQLLELEKAYPYTVFASVGMLVDHFDCSICGGDIDSNACPHRRGHLYDGVMAHGVAQGAVSLDHVALTTTPDDKRCVVEYKDDDDRFKLVRFIADLVEEGQCRSLDFSHLAHSVRSVRNEAYRLVGRNQPCFCGSGKNSRGAV